MARENQGLQIALIVFVMLTIVLGVTTYLFYRNWEDANNRVAAKGTELDRAVKQAGVSDAEANGLKRLMGVAQTEKLDTITTTFGEDMKRFGGSYPEQVRFYRPLMEKMQQTINEKNTTLAQAEAKIHTLEDTFKVRESIKQPQLDNFAKAAQDAAGDLTKEREKFKSDRDRSLQQEASLSSALATVRKDSEAAVAKIEAKVRDGFTVNQKLKDINSRLATKQAEVLAEKFTVPDGEVRWVNQHTGTVWINLGRADALHRQVTFSVYPADLTDMTAGGKKGSIEVTQILGDHLAEARISDDKMTDPIMPGDKIHTPVWTPGEKRHFAVAGLIDIDGDGMSDISTFVDLITSNGGVVDCYIDDKGKQHGQINIGTRYLVLGDAPNEKGQAGMRDAFSKITGDAKRYGLQNVAFGDLLQQMGWKNPTPVVRFGRGSNPKDFAPKPEEGVPRRSTGNVSDVFKPRTPPTRVPSSAY
jgi:hypothetical protein